MIPVGHLGAKSVKVFCCQVSGSVSATTPTFITNMMGGVEAFSSATFTINCSDDGEFPCHYKMDFLMRDSSTTYDSKSEDRTMTCNSSETRLLQFLNVSVDSGKTIMVEAYLRGIDDCDPGGPREYLVSMDFQSAMSP